MNKVAKFDKVSIDNFISSFFSLQNLFGYHHNNLESSTDLDDSFKKEITTYYNKLILPKRATKGSAGYDFFSPFDFELKPDETIKIPTGIRCKMNDDVVLMIFPRSSLGFKYHLTLDNTVGIIDSDYYYSDNEGHIFIKFTNSGKKVLNVKTGDGIAQGIFLPYFLTEDDDTVAIRNGGIGSTNNK